MPGRLLIHKFSLLAPLFLVAACGARTMDAEAGGGACAKPGDPVFIQGGDFIMGADDAYPEEGPAHRVSVALPWWTLACMMRNRAAQLWPCAVLPGSARIAIRGCLRQPFRRAVAEKPEIAHPPRGAAFTRSACNRRS